MFLICLQPKSSINHCHSANSNWCPHSVMTEYGIPNQDIQQMIKAQTTVSAVMSGIGVASVHLVNLSIHRYTLPTMSMCMLENLTSGVLNLPCGDVV